MSREMMHQDFVTVQSLCGQGERDSYRGRYQRGIGWSVVTPTLLGAAIGAWLDSHHAGSRSWTLTLMFAGLVLGCWSAWQWVSKEDKAIREEQEDSNE